MSQPQMSAVTFIFVNLMSSERKLIKFSASQTADKGEAASI